MDNPKEVALVFIPTEHPEPAGERFACRFLSLNKEHHIYGQPITALNVAEAIDEHYKAATTTLEEPTQASISQLQLRFEAALETALDGLEKLSALARSGELQKSCKANKNTHHTYVTFVRAVGEFRATGRKLIQVGEKSGIPCEAIINTVTDPLFSQNYFDDAVRCARKIAIRFGVVPANATPTNQSTLMRAIERLAFVFAPGHTQSPIPFGKVVEAIVLNPGLPGKVTAVNLADAVEFYCKSSGTKTADAMAGNVREWATEFEQSSYHVTQFWNTLRELDASGELGKDGHPNENPTYVLFVKSIGRMIETGRLLVGAAGSLGVESNAIADVVASPLTALNGAAAAISQARRVAVNCAAREPPQPAEPTRQHPMSKQDKEWRMIQEAAKAYPPGKLAMGLVGFGLAAAIIYGAFLGNVRSAVFGTLASVILCTLLFVLKTYVDDHKRSKAPVPLAAKIFVNFCVGFVIVLMSMLAFTLFTGWPEFGAKLIFGK